MMLIILVMTALGLTIAMFASKRMELGFPSAIFWALAGGHSYTLSTAMWDMYYFLFFASVVGMVPFSAFAAFGLRTKKEEIEAGEEMIDEGKDDVKFIDESEAEKKEEAEMSPRRKEIRSRAKTRRTGRSGSKFDSLGFRYD